MSVKFQITFPDPLMARLRQASKRENVSVAEFVRETVQQRLQRHSKRTAAHPLAAIIGIADIEDTDLASRVDEIYDD
jgi:metal-responsive CopG/Arc/MetJ family transcriptional regulator